MSEETLVRRIIVEGFVQGVGYREFTRSAALKFCISGWVRNRPDGAVEAVVQGAPADVEAMLTEMRRGPRSAMVTGLRLLDPHGADEIKAGAFVIRSAL
jgi:acylphosphatase